MLEVEVDGQIFSVDDCCLVEKVDEWASYRKAQVSGVKACDLAIIVPGGDLFLVEVKDYSYAEAAPPSDLDHEVLRKAIGSLGIFASLKNMEINIDEMNFSRAALNCRRIVVVLSIELATGVDVVRTQKILTDYKQQLRRSGRRYFGDFKVVTARAPQDGVPFSSRRNPERRLDHDDSPRHHV